MSRSKKLYKLQGIDTAIDRAQERISEINRLLSQDEELKAAEAKLQTSKRKLDEKKKILKRAEREVKDQDRKIKENEAKLYGGNVTNPKELEDLQLESESLHRYLGVLEERQLEAMLAVDQAESEYRDNQKTLKDIKEKRKSNHATLNAEKEDLLEEIDSLQHKRKSVVDDIDDNDLQLYQDLRERLGGIAVSRITNDSCSACGTQVPSATSQEARSPSQLTHCMTCNRILHAD